MWKMPINLLSKQIFVIFFRIQTSQNEFLSNDAITEFLQLKTDKNFTRTNKNANGVIGMKSHFGEEGGKARAIEFNKAISNIKKIKTGAIVSPPAQSGDTKISKKERMKGKINQIVKSLNKEPKKHLESKDQRGNKRVLGGGRVLSENEESKEYENAERYEKRPKRKERRRQSTFSNRSSVDATDEVDSLPFLKSHPNDFYNFPL